MAGFGAARLGGARHGGARRGIARQGRARQGKTRQGNINARQQKGKEKRKMKECLVTLKGVAPYSQSRFHNTEKLEKEAHDDYEKRTWRNKLHVNTGGRVFIPPMAFKNCLSECAKYLSVQIPGKGKTTYTKHFEAGVLVTEPLVLPLKPEDVKGEWLHVPSDGRRGGTKRVLKCFPLIPHWTGEVLFYIFDETITEEVFNYHLDQAGKFIGIGRFRPRNNGYYGRFDIVGDIMFA